MTHLFVSILGILLTVFFVIGTHEAAHFLMARLLGVKVLRFSIGFGKRLWHCYDKLGTEYVLALIPLGGYVQMLDEREGSVKEEELPFAYNRQPFYKKCLIVIAGPLTNIFCALILYWLIFMIGFTTIRPIIGNIDARSIAAESGLKANQEITQIDAHPTMTWASILFRILAHTGNEDTLTITVENRCHPSSAPQTCLPNKEMHRLDLSNWHLDSLTPDPLKSLGITPYQPDIPLIIGMIDKNSSATVSKLQIGDHIKAVNETPIKNWEMLITFILNHPDENVIFHIKRQNNLVTIPLTIGHHYNLFLQKSGYLGISPTFQWPEELQRKIKYGPLEAFSHAGQMIMDFTYFNLLLFGKMVAGKLSLQSLGGPIVIFQSAGDALNDGFLAFISFLAFLSLSIGIINFLPVPGLDGGHLFIQFIEFIIRKPLPENMLLFLYRLGFLLIFFILIQAIVNDVLRLF